MSFQGSKFRERLLPISFLESFYFPRVLPLMGDRLFPSNLVHSFRGFQFSLWSFAILMCTLINHGKIYLQFYLADIRLDLLKYYKKVFVLSSDIYISQGKYIYSKAHVSHVYPISQFF